jgi:hypothetical protein
MPLCRVAALTGLVFCVLAGHAAAQVPLSGNLPTWDNAPAAPAPGAGGMAPPPGAMQPSGPPPGLANSPGMGGGMAGPPPGMGGPPRGEPPCMRDFLPLKEAAEKRAGLIKQAAETKAPREKVCGLFKNFAAAEAKVVKFVVDNQTMCQVPPQAVSQMQANHDRTLKTRDQVCASGPMPGAAAAPPPGPRLSDEIGVRGVIGAGGDKPGRGTFDTLTGNALSR